MYDHVLITYAVIMFMVAVAWEMNWKAAIVGAALMLLSFDGHGYLLDWYNLYIIAWAMLGLSFLCSRYVIIVLVAFGLAKKF
jgi:hypothetical protein